MSKSITFRKAAFINACSKYINVILQIFISAVLARILSPTDYGIVAIIAVFTTFFTVLSNVGFGTAIIQNKSLNNSEINEIYSVTVYIAIITSIFFLLFSYPISIFYNNPVYIKLGSILAISVFFNIANMVLNALLLREKKFMTIAFRTVIIYIVVSILTIGMALLGWKYYAISLQSVLTAFLTFGWNFASTRPKMLIKPSLNSIRKIWKYSIFQFAHNILDYFACNLDNLLIGKIMGVSNLGFYNKAYTLSVNLVGNISGVISPILHPMLSEYQNDSRVLYKKYMQIHNFIGIIAGFITVCGFLASNEIILIVFGDKWENTISCFRFLSIVIFPQMVNGCTGAVLQSLGKTNLLFKSTVINTIITIISIIVGVLSGSIKNVAIMVAIAYIFHYIVAQFITVKYGFRLKLSAFISESKFNYFNILILFFSALMYPWHISNIILSIFLKFAYICVIFCIFLIVTKQYTAITTILKIPKVHKISELSKI